MSQRTPTFTIAVDVTNPGQFFACCGLLELAHRLWPDAEGWFDLAEGTFSVSTERPDAGLGALLHQLCSCEISGLTEQERREQADLERRSRELKRQGQALPSEEEKRRKALGDQARAGALQLGSPFGLTLNWWQDKDAPKTWAGRQELHKIARAAQDAISRVPDPESLFSYSQVLNMPSEYCNGKNDHKKPVAPFFFDPRRFSHALDAGWSLDVQEAEASSHPAVELLCLIGLQRFRPSVDKERFYYRAWSRPLQPVVGTAVASNSVFFPEGGSYEFQMRYRDDQRRYKAFGFSTRMGDQE